MTVAVRLAWSMRSASPMTIWHSARTRRSGTTTWRGEMEPAAASGRNGWYVMYGSGSTTVISACPASLRLELPLQTQRRVHPDVAAADHENARRFLSPPHDATGPGLCPQARQIV